MNYKREIKELETLWLRHRDIAHKWAHSNRPELGAMQYRLALSFFQEIEALKAEKAALDRIEFV